MITHAKILFIYGYLILCFNFRLTLSRASFIMVPISIPTPRPKCSDKTIVDSNLIMNDLPVCQTIFLNLQLCHRHLKAIPCGGNSADFLIMLCINDCSKSLHFVVIIDYMIQ